MIKDISLKDFVELMKPIKDYQKDYEAHADALDVLYPDSYVIPTLGANLQDKYIDLLQLYCGDKDLWIEYYVHECEFGKNKMEITVDKKSIYLTDFESLYNFLCDIYNKED